MFVAAVAPSRSAVAQSPADQVQTGVNDIGGNEGGNERPLPSRIKSFINVFLFVIGALAVLMAVYGGLKFVISRGDPAEVASAKNTILYALAGLVIALLAYAVVEFVVTNFTEQPKQDETSRDETQQTP